MTCALWFLGNSVENRLGYRSGILVGFFVGILIFMVPLLIIYMKSKKKSQKTGYDERQEIIRGKAFKYGFYTMFAYFMILYLWHALKFPMPLDTSAELILGIVAGIIPFACYSLWKDAYFRMGDNRTALLILFALIGTLNTALGIRSVFFGQTSPEKKDLSQPIVNLTLGFLFLCLLAVCIVKTIKDREEEETE